MVQPPPEVPHERTQLPAVTCEKGTVSTTTWNTQPWTGKTIFNEQLPGQELEHSNISDSFFKMLCSSQRGYLLMFYDKNREKEDRPRTHGLHHLMEIHQAQEQDSQHAQRRVSRHRPDTLAPLPPTRTSWSTNDID